MPSISRVSGHLLAMGFVGATSMFATSVVAQDFPMSAPSSASTGAQIGAQSTDADFEAMLSGAIPVEQLLDLASRSAPGAPQAQAAPMMATGSPMVHGGQQGASIRITVDEDTLRAADGTSASESLATALADAGIGPQNYGQNQANSLYHYNDYREFPRPTFYPERTIGRLYFQKVSGGGWYTCTATLIARAILVTAGHCVYDGDPDNNGSWVGNTANFNSDGYFYPTYSDADGGTATPRFGRCRIERWSTTPGWYNGGGLDQAYDIGLALCGRLEGARLNRYNGTLPGQRLGYMSFCYSNCRQPYWFLSQFGFPGNYYDGGEMTVSQHVEVAGMPDPVGGSTTRDYIYGTGMRGGSSGGPHISNVGAISDSASNLGQYTVRNVIFAVTSWGFTNAQWKIQGASPLSGVNNDINFQRMFNQMCRVSRRTYGRNSCSLI